MYGTVQTTHQLNFRLRALSPRHSKLCDHTRYREGNESFKEVYRWHKEIKVDRVAPVARAAVNPVAGNPAAVVVAQAVEAAIVRAAVVVAAVPAVAAIAKPNARRGELKFNSPLTFEFTISLEQKPKVESHSMTSFKVIIFD